MQHELTQGLSINGGIFWRRFGNFLVTDNTSATVATSRGISVTPTLIPAAPASSGGEQLPDDTYTDRFFNLNPGVAVNNLTGLSKTMFPGSNVYDKWFGYDIGLNVRLPQGIIFQGGLSTGHQQTDFCDVQDPAKAGNNALVEMLVRAGGAPISLKACHMDQKWLPQVKFLGSYTIPKIDVQFGASFQSIPGIEYAAIYSAPNSDVSRPVAQGGLGRLPAGGVAAGTTNVNLIPPGTIVRPALQPDRHASGQSRALLEPQGGREPRPVQHPQRRHDRQRQPRPTTRSGWRRRPSSRHDWRRCRSRSTSKQQSTVYGLRSTVP